MERNQMVKFKFMRECVKVLLMRSKVKSGLIKKVKTINMKDIIYMSSSTFWQYVIQQYVIEVII